MLSPLLSGDLLGPMLSPRLSGDLLSPMLGDLLLSGDLLGPRLSPLLSGDLLGPRLSPLLPGDLLRSGDLALGQGGDLGENSLTVHCRAIIQVAIKAVKLDSHTKGDHQGSLTIQP